MRRFVRRCLVASAIAELALVAAGVVGIGVVRFRSQRRFDRVEQHLAASSEAERAAAVRAVIEAGRREESDGNAHRRRYVRADELPAALASAPPFPQDVIGARWGESHVTLIVRTGPDTQSGFRVWLGEQSRGWGMGGGV